MTTPQGASGTLISHQGKTVLVETQEGSVKRCHFRRTLPPLCIGDHITWEQDGADSGVVTECAPRKNTLMRRDNFGREKLLAANIDCAYVVMAPHPPFTLEQIDQYLAACELCHIPCNLIFNKIDLLKEDENENLDKAVALYQQLGLMVLKTSAHAGAGVTPIHEALKSQKAIFIGPSGVGKSSLINALLPGVNIKTGDLSERSGLGCHTTTAGYLYHLDSGGLIDSPGIREFGLWPMSRNDLAGGFRELAPLRGNCQFRNCHHDKDAGCALIAAYNAGTIVSSRWQSYQKLAEKFCAA